MSTFDEKSLYEPENIIDIEVEVGDGVIFCIVEEAEGFWLEYKPDILAFYSDGRHDFSLIKDYQENLEWVIGDIKRVMEELNIHVPHFALRLDCIGGIGKRTTCIVDKGKEIIYLCLVMNCGYGGFGITIYNEEIPYDHIYYHELMHAKDTLEGRFPSCGSFVPSNAPELSLLTSLWHFSIEGRLQKLGKPHKEKEDTVTDEYDYMSSWYPNEKRFTKKFFQELCDELWGKEVTFQELQSIISQALSGVAHESIR